ncbi:MAG: hypothetical protein EOO51_01485 [Flavobacterium sp.]|nr:MAG: hypothetical protein EOO51_01485 [Flavobacterium sp.]
MSYLKYTPYVYLLAGLFFVYDGITKLKDPEGGYWLSFIIAFFAIFLFFFRRHFAKKFESRRKGN